MCTTQGQAQRIVSQKHKCTTLALRAQHEGGDRPVEHLLTALWTFILFKFLRVFLFVVRLSRTETNRRNLGMNLTTHLNRNLGDTACLNCRDAVTLSPSPGLLTCPSCQHTYPVFDHIPILLQDPDSSLAAAHGQHQALIDENTKWLETVRDAAGRQPHRAALLNRAIHAYESNNDYLNGLQATIERQLPKSKIDELRAEDRLPRQYDLDEGISFFHRDWCWSERAETEIAEIVDTIQALVNDFADDVDRVLVPGAGAGRFACELASTYDHCLAFDYCVHMAQIFYDLLDRDVTLSKVHFRSNVVKTDDVVVEDILSIDAPGSRRIRSQLEQGNLSYIITNALDLPLPGNSLSAIVCVYFIDIVPLKTHLNEIRRTLKPGGLFINIGPLRFMRGDVANMLSGEEIMDLFRESGFDILADGTVTNTQLTSSPVITSILSHNFMFVARKR